MDDRRCQGGKCRCMKAGNGCNTTADCRGDLVCSRFNCRFVG